MSEDPEFIRSPSEARFSGKKKLPIYARSGWEIPQKNIQGLPPAELAIKAREQMGWRGNIEIRSVSNYPYNCVGLIFASRRAFIEIDHIYEILKQDGYRPIAYEKIKEGDIVLYKDDKELPCHVALVSYIERIRSVLNIKAISKWGLEAEFIHFVENVPPLFGKPMEYYTDRVELNE